MPPSDVARVMSASRSGLLMNDLVPRMHMMDDRTTAKDSLHLSQLIITGKEITHAEIRKSLGNPEISY